MGHEIYDLNEITESRIMMEHKLAPISIIFTYGLIFFTVIVLIWASIGEIDIVVKARGIVRTKETGATVVSTASGAVKTIHVADFQLIKKGELLLSLDDTELQLQRNALKIEREQLNQSLAMAQKFITGIEEKKNPFNKKLEEAYYLQFEKFKLDHSIANQITVLENQIYWENTKMDLTQKLELLDQKNELLDMEISHSEIRASTDGIYNPILNLVINDMIVEGTKIGTIVPGESEAFNAGIMLENYDIERANIGDKVKFKIDALPYTEYGFIIGEITSISPDSTIDPNTGISYYKVMAKIKNTPVKSYKGIEKNIKEGMTFEAHIVTDRKKVLRFLLEKVQLWV